MAVEAIPITDNYFFWRCDCGWESEKLPITSRTLPPPRHDCKDTSEFRAKESA